MKFNLSNTRLLHCFIISIYLLTSCSAEKNEVEENITEQVQNSNDNNIAFTITGTIDNSSNQKIYLFEYGSKSPIKLDSSNVSEQGEFSLTGKTLSYKFYSIGNKLNNVTPLLLGGGESVKVIGDANEMSISAKIEGSDDSNLMNEFSAKQKAFFDSMQHYKTVMESYAYDENEKREVIIKKAELAKNEFNLYKYDFINKNSNSPAIYLAANELNNLIEDLPHLKVIEKVMFEKMNGSPFHIAVSQKIAQANQILAQQKRQLEMIEQQKKAFANAGIEIGKEIPNLNFPNPNGKNISLNSLKGNIVLLDFWASWCRPCRAENPNVVKLYNKYKNKGFTIYSFSLDNNAQNWKTAIQQDGLTWPNHVSDLKGWNSAGSALYNVSSIPQTFLIGRDGKLIEIGLRGIELENKLKELLE